MSTDKDSSELIGFDDMEEDDDDDFESDGWDEMEDDSPLTADCFFCSNTFRSIDTAVSHIAKDHGFHLSKLKAKHKMDCYSFIKLVNYMRTLHPSCEQIMSCDVPPWTDDKYLTPVNREDPWLMFDFEDLEEADVLPRVDIPKTGYHVNAEDGRVTLSELHFVELQHTIQNLNVQIKEKDEGISQLMEEMKRMKVTLGDVVVGDAGTGAGALLNKHVADIRLEDDEEYFYTYAHFGIHHEMLLDTVRTESYQNALCHNSATINGKTVLDLGCGTGILSMFAAQAGASQVIAVDQSDIIYHAMDIVRENGLNDRIVLVKGRIEDVELPENKVDVIVSEWMGYFLLFEAMLDSVIYARDKHLRPGGLLLPNRCTINLVAASDPAMHAEMLGFWSNVYGFKMTSLRGDVVREPRTCVVPPDTVATTTAQLCLLDLLTVTPDCIDFNSDFTLVASRDTQLTALVGFFDVFFDLPNAISFSTSPLCKPTHWKQTVFLIPEPITVKQGEVINGSLVCRRNRKEVRSLIVTITLGSMKQKYLLS